MFVCARDEVGVWLVVHESRAPYLWPDVVVVVLRWQRHDEFEDGIGVEALTYEDDAVPHLTGGGDDGLVVRWFGDLAVWWFGGSVVRWFGGLVVWWFGGLVVWCSVVGCAVATAATTTRGRADGEGGLYSSPSGRRKRAPPARHRGHSA